MAVHGFSRSTSQVYLELLGDTSKFDVKKLQELGRQLENAEKLGKATTGSIKKMLDEAIKLSKTPFVDKRSLDASARVIRGLAASLDAYKNRYLAFVKLTEASQNRFNTLKAGGFIGMRREEVEYDKQRVERLKRITSQLELEYLKQRHAYESYVKAYEASSKRLKQIDDTRNRMAKSIYSFVDNRRFLSEKDRSMAFGIAQMFEQANPNTATGQRQIATAINQWNAFTSAMIRQKAEMSGLMRAWEKFRVVFSRVVDALLSFYVITAAQTLFFGFFQSLIKSNQLIEETEARLKALLVTAEKFARAQSKLRELTVATPFTYQELVESSALVRAYGVDIEKNMRAVVDWASAVKRDLTDTAVAFGKITAGSPRSQMLLSTRGFSMAMYETYLVQYRDRALALNKMIDDMYGGTAERLSRTFEGLLANMNDVWIFISQELGKPLFQSLKNDIQTLFNLLKALSAPGNSTLAWIGEFLNFLVSITVTLGFASGINFLISKIPTGIGAIIASTLTWEGILKVIGTRFMLIFSVLESISAVKGSLQLNELVAERERLENQTGGTARERLERERAITDNIEQQIRKIRDSNFLVEAFQIAEKNRLYDTLEVRKKIVAALEQEVKLEQARQAFQMAKGSTLQNYKLGNMLRDYDLAGFIQGVSNELTGKLVSRTGATAQNVDFLLAKQKWLNELLKPMTKTEALQKIKQEIRTFVLDSGGDIDDLRIKIVEFMNEFQVSVEELSEFFKGGKKGTAFDRTRFDELGAQIDSYSQSLQKQLAVVRGNIGAYESLYGALKNKSVADLIAQSNAMEANKANEKGRLVILQLVESLIKFKDMTKVAFDTKPIDEYNRRVGSLKEKARGLAENVGQKQFSYYGVNELGQLYDSRQKTTTALRQKMAAAKPYSKELLDATDKYLVSLKREYELYLLLQDSSTNYGEAYLGVLAEIRQKNQELYDDVARMSVDFLSETGRGIFDELLFGTTRDRLTSEIDDLRFKLIQIQAEKAGRQLIEDTEVSTLARINELEAERANVILPILENALQSVSDKMSDMLFSQIAEQLLNPLLSDEEMKKKANLQAYADYFKEVEKSLTFINTVQMSALNFSLNENLNLYKSILATITMINSQLITKQFLDAGITGGSSPIPKTGSSPIPAPIEKRMGGGIVRGFSQSTTIINQNIVQIPGNIYGFDDFKRKVDDANRALKGRSI